MVENNHSYGFIVTDQDNVSLFEFTLIVRRHYNVYFHIICGDIIYPPGINVIAILSISLQSKISLMYIIWNILAECTLF